MVWYESFDWFDRALLGWPLEGDLVQCYELGTDWRFQL